MRPLIISFQMEGVAYYRAHLAAKEMRNKGMDPYVVTGMGDLGMPFDKWLLENARDFDVIHAGYTTDLKTVELLVAARNYARIPLIIDIDDDINNVPMYNSAFKAYHGGTQERRIARFCLKVADMVSVSTEHLKTVLTAAPMTVLPNCVNKYDWEHPEGPQRDFVTIMFAGNIGRYGDLESIHGALEHIMNKYDNVRLYFLGCLPEWVEKNWMPSRIDPTQNRAFFMRGCRVELYRAILKYLKPDIFISPVEENLFNKSKSHIKAYDAAMIPADFICTDWETYADVPCRMKVRGEYEWKEALEHSIENQGRRRARALSLRSWALTEWDITKHIDKWLDLYNRAVETGPILDVRDALARFDNGRRNDDAQQQDSVKQAGTDHESGAGVRGTG